MSRVKSRREQYSDETKAALLEAATRRFAELGFTKTSLEDVAADIRATRGAVYHHFANKTALFEAVFDALELDLLDQVNAASAEQSDPWAAGEAALAVFLDRCCDPAYGRIVWREAPIALGWERWHEREGDYNYGLIEQLIRALIDNGDLPPMPLDVMTNVTFHVLGAAGMALAEAPPEDKTRVRDEYAEVIRHLLTSALISDTARRP